MITFYKTSKYDRERDKYVKNNSTRAEQLIKALQLLSTDPQSPGLNVEKISKDMYTLRINKGDRLFFMWIDKETILLLDIGEHDKYRRH